MKRRLFIPSLLLAAGFGAVGGKPAAGELITFLYSGELTREAQRDGVLNGELGVGESTTFAGTYTFESTTPDAHPNDPDEGRYEGAITDVTGYILGSGGPIQFSGPLDEPPDAVTNFILVGDDIFFRPSDAYSVFNVVRLLDVPMFFELSLTDFSATIFEDELLPVDPPPLESFDTARFRMITDDDAQLFLSGELHELRLVPDPATGCLLGLAAMAAMRRLSRGHAGSPTLQENGS